MKRFTFIDVCFNCEIDRNILLIILQLLGLCTVI